jgi:hypothetical protein
LFLISSSSSSNISIIFLHFFPALHCIFLALSRLSLGITHTKHHHPTLLIPLPTTPTNSTKIK